MPVGRGLLSVVTPDGDMHHIAFCTGEEGLEVAATHPKYDATDFIFLDQKMGVFQLQSGGWSLNMVHDPEIIMLE
jgi:hypothetical protein